MYVHFHFFDRNHVDQLLSPTLVLPTFPLVSHNNRISIFLIHCHSKVNLLNLLVLHHQLVHMLI